MRTLGKLKSLACREIKVSEFHKSQDEESHVGLQHGLGQRGSRVTVGSVLSAVSHSVIQAKWGCRYEQGRNYSDDMMRDPEVMLSLCHHLHSALHGLKPCEAVCVCWFVSFLSGPMWCSHSGNLPLTSIKKESDAHFLLPSGMPVLPRGRGAP